MKFERSSNGRLALVAAQGNLLVDTGACTSVCSPNVYSGTVDHTNKEELYSVDDSPLKACGQIRPKLRLGEEATEDAAVTFQVVEGISENILSVNRAVDEGAGVWFSADECYILWPDGGKATFSRQGKQFILPFEELSGKHRQTQIAHINEDDEDAQAVRDWEMQRDEEAEAVLEYAQREEEARQAEERAEEDPGLLADLEAEGEPPAAPEAQELGLPATPSEDEMRRHRLTHLPFAPWCEECVSGKAREDHHSQSNTQTVERKVQMDYFFLSKEEAVEDESTLITVLCMTDLASGWPLAMQLPSKSTETSQSKYVLQNIDLHFRKLGYDKVILQHDGEPAIRALGESIQQYVGASRVSLREAPPRSHQAQGAVESMNGFVQAHVRALWLDVRRRYPDRDLVCNLLPWLIRHAAWLIARFHTRSRDQMTPYRLVTGSDYSHPLATLGEVVLGKLPTTKSKAQRRWVKGLRLGKLDRDDSHILGTSSGAIAVRSVRRLPLESQTDGVMMKAMKGIPWQPRDGVWHRITRDISRALPIALPPAAGTTAPDAEAREDEEKEEHPTLAEDGQNVDIDGLTVEAAAQLEEVVGPDEDELPADSPAEEGQSAPSAPQPPPFRGAGWSSPMQALPDEPMSPSGLGSGGKREAPPGGRC